MASPKRRCYNTIACLEPVKSALSDMVRQQSPEEQDRAKQTLKHLEELDEFLFKIMNSSEEYDMYLQPVKKEEPVLKEPARVPKISKSRAEMNRVYRSRKRKRVRRVVMGDKKSSTWLFELTSSETEEVEEKEVWQV